MLEYLMHTKARTASLERNQPLEIAFDPGVGPIRAEVSAVPMLVVHKPGFDPVEPDPGQYKIELRDHNGVVLKQELNVPTLSYTATAAQAAGAGQWKLRIINLNQARIKYAAQVDFSTGELLKTASVPLETFNTILRLTGLSSIRIHLHSGENGNDEQGTIDIGNSPLRDAVLEQGVKLPIRFFVPKATISIPIIDDPVARLSNVNSSTVEIFGQKGSS